MEEVIARRKNVVMLNGILMAVCGFVLIGLGIWQVISGNNPFMYIILNVFGCACVAYGAYQTAVFFATPKIIITYGAGVLHLPKNLNCLPSDIEDIKISTVKRYGAEADYGALTLVIKGAMLRYKNVEEVAKVKKRLEELKEEKRNG